MRRNRHESDEKFRTLINLNSSVLYVLFPTRIYFSFVAIAGPAIFVIAFDMRAFGTWLHRECKCDCAFIDRMNSDLPTGSSKLHSNVVNEFNKLHRILTTRHQAHTHRVRMKNLLN